MCPRPSSISPARQHSSTQWEFQSNSFLSSILPPPPSMAAAASSSSTASIRQSRPAVPLSAFAFLFSELVQYHCGSIAKTSDLELKCVARCARGCRRPSPRPFCKCYTTKATLHPTHPTLTHPHPPFSHACARYVGSRRAATRWGGATTSSRAGSSESGADGVRSIRSGC